MKREGFLDCSSHHQRNPSPLHREGKRGGFLFEICANGVESCLAAQAGGADRVELCAGIPEGGTTPSYGEIKQARQLLTTTRLHVIIRPRGGNFVYSPLEIDRMLTDIRIARELGADGVVFGCLTADGDIDMALNSKLIQETQDMSTTFHRAFDRVRNPEQALEQIIDLGFDRILTSGLAPTAEAGIPQLRRLTEQAADRIILMAGCGVNENNIARIHRETSVREFHFSAREPVGPSDCEFGTRMLTTPERVKVTISQLNSQAP